MKGCFSTRSFSFPSFFLLQLPFSSADFPCRRQISGYPCAGSVKRFPIDFAGVGPRKGERIPKRKVLNSARGGDRRGL